MGSLTKALIGKEDVDVQDDELYPSTFSRLNSTGSTITLTSFPDIWKTHQNAINARSYGTQVGTTINSAVVAGTTCRDIYLDAGEWVVSNSLDWSAYTTTRWIFAGGAYLTLNAGVTVTFPSPSNIIASPNQQIFSGAGTVAFGESQGTWYPGWWGSSPSASAAVNASAFSACASSLLENGRMVIPGSKANYQFSSGFTVNKEHVTLDFYGKLEFTGTSGAAITIGDAVSELESVKADINIIKAVQDWTETCTGVRLHGVKYSNLHFRLIEGFTYGLELGKAGATLNCYYNNIYLERIANNKRGISFTGPSGGMNANTFYGGAFIDNNLGGSEYADSYGIYIGNLASVTNGNTFISPRFELLSGSSYDRTNDIYCDGDYNTFIDPRCEGGCSDARIRFGTNATWNMVTTSFTSKEEIYDASGNNLITTPDYHKPSKGCAVHSTTAYNTNNQTYKAGDRWNNNGYNSIDDSPGKICITKGSYFTATAKTATTGLASATVTISASPTDIPVGAIIDIAGVTGPLEVTARDCINSTITISPVADAAVAGAAITFTAPTFADETPASIRGYKTWNPGSGAIADGDSAITTVVCTGAAMPDMVVVGPGVTTQGMSPWGYVSNTDEVTLGVTNNTGAPVTMGNSSWGFRVIKY